MALLAPPPKVQFLGDDGLPLSGGLIYTYEKDTTVPLATYTDSTGSQANTNPIVLDSQGRASIWYQILPYSLVIYNAIGELQSCSGPIEFPPSTISGSDIEAYSDIVVYNFPDLVAGSDGYTYRCVGTNVLDDDPTTSTSGDWVNLSSMASVALTGTPTAPTAAPGTNTTQIATTAFVQAAIGTIIGREIIGGDITVTAATTLSITACECWDSTRAVSLKTTETKTITAPTGSTWAASTLYYIYQVRVTSGSTIEFRAYNTEGGAAADATINAYRFIDYWLTTGATALFAGYSKNGVHWNTKASESAVNSFTSLPSGCSTAVSLSSFIPNISLVDSVLLSLHGDGFLNGPAVIGFDGTNAFGYVSGQGALISDNDVYAWGAPANFMPLQTSNVYWGDGTTTIAGQGKLLLHAVKLRR